MVEGLGWLIVTSARMVLKSLFVITRSFRPWGGRKPGEGGAIWARVISMKTGNLADLVIEAMHCVRAVCLVSHSFSLSLAFEEVVPRRVDVNPTDAGREHCKVQL